MVSQGRPSMVSHGVVSHGRPSKDGPSHGRSSVVSQYTGRSSAFSTLEKPQPVVEEATKEHEEYYGDDDMDDLIDVNLDMFGEEGDGGGKKAPDDALDYTMTVNWASR